MTGPVWSVQSPSPTGETWIILCGTARRAAQLATEWGIPSYLYPAVPERLRGLMPDEYVRVLWCPTFETRSDYQEIVQLVSIIDATSTRPVEYIHLTGVGPDDLPPANLHDLEAVEKWLSS